MNQARQTVKRAIIMGATSGIGEEVFRLMLKDEDCFIGIAGRRADRLEALKALAPHRVAYETIDVCHPEATLGLQRLIGKVGGMDVYFHASGIGKVNRELTEFIEMSTVETNVCGFTRMVGEAFRYMAAHDGGHIAAITSVAGTKGIGIASSYSSSKAFQQAYLQALEQLAHVRRLPIRFTDIRPGFVATAFLDGSRPYPLMMKPADVAASIMRAVGKQEHVRVIDARWRILAACWRRLPKWLWRRLPVDMPPGAGSRQAGSR